MHARGLGELLASLDALPTPRERLIALVEGWVGEREMAARHGCPFGSLTAELHKRDDPLDGRAAEVMGVLIDWAQRQFAVPGRADARELAVALIAAYQGIAMLTNTFRDPELMVAEGRRLVGWIEAM
ncbi:TetR family transcriptional regulator C-terminal domain-containing protein [Nocardia puris]|uniref:Tetracyclin repressor-like C-terminal domain-containing protein n=1 Tax=Nocardia puris TaxID=208602 RepID=A0A366E472_9NOCA|nr:hypothetical protein [Nocardia puris]RBO96198.1 hypothetical protein DFR74_101209 [Nocardia puris]